MIDKRDLFGKICGAQGNIRAYLEGLAESLLEPIASVIDVATDEALLSSACRLDAGLNGISPSNFPDEFDGARTELLTSMQPLQFGQLRSRLPGRQRVYVKIEHDVINAIFWNSRQVYGSPGITIDRDEFMNARTSTDAPDCPTVDCVAVYVEPLCTVLYMTALEVMRWGKEGRKVDGREKILLPLSMPDDGVRRTLWRVAHGLPIDAFINLIDDQRVLDIATSKGGLRVLEAQRIAAVLRQMKQ